MSDAQNRYFELRRSSIQGRGAFALRKIRKGTRVTEYRGERISNDEADRRYDDDSMPRHHTFLFTLDDDTCIDGAVAGNEAAYINHSCDPNCEAVIAGGRIWIEAIRTIYPGEELHYDYKYEREVDGDVLEPSQYPCNCGSAGCRGTILLPEKKKVRRKRTATKKTSRARR